MESLIFWTLLSLLVGTLLVPDVGEQKLLDFALKTVTPPAQTLRLFTNDITPAEGDTAATYTEAVGNGYAPIALTRAGWTISTTAGVTKAEQTQKTFTFTGGPVSVYGYYVTEDTTGVLLWAERFPAGPANIPAGGGDIKITPRIEQD